jgi:hypothetical protein
MIIRGYIEKGEEISHHCCDGGILFDAVIGGKSLYNTLDDRFDLDPAVGFDFYDDGTKEDPQKAKFDNLEKTGVSYLVLDEDPGNRSYEDVVGEWIVKKLYTEHVTGCYSEYTCGVGGYNYFIDGGHNILNEILSHVGKYVLLNIRDFREVQIDMVLSGGD